MSQTAKKEPPTSDFKRGRPGQRQQERLQRRERRRRRLRTVLSIILTVVLIAFAGVIFWQVERYNEQVAKTAEANASATATVNNGNSTATVNSQASATATVNNGYSTATAVVVNATASVRSANITATAKTYAGTPTPVVPAQTPAPDVPPAVDGTLVKLDDGLQYVDITEGVGMPAQSVYNTKVYYTGWVEGGTKFDSSADHGGVAFEPNPSQGLIQGWVEGVVGMKVGGTRRLIIPPDLAYGAQGAGDGAIPPNATLIFDVTLVALK